MVQQLDRRSEPRRLYQQIADQIRGLIRSGQLPALSRLPAERDLAQQLNVSRPSLREALIALEIDGAVEIRMGSGVYVCAPADRLPGPMRALGESPSELMQARSAVEGCVVALACARMTPAALVALHKTLEGMRSAIEADRKPIEDDRLFHITIAIQAGNSVLTRIVGELFDGRHSPISNRMHIKYGGRESWLQTLAEHEAIVAALEAADPLWSQAAMRTHLHRSADRWTSAV